MQKIIGFLSNAMGLLFYRCIENPHKAATAIFQEIDPAIRFTFDNSKYDTTEDARVYKRELLTELYNLTGAELERNKRTDQIKEGASCRI